MFQFAPIAFGHHSKEPGSKLHALGLRVFIYTDMISPELSLFHAKQSQLFQLLFIEVLQSFNNLCGPYWTLSSMSMSLFNRGA